VLKKIKLFQIFFVGFLLLSINTKAAETPKLIINKLYGKTFDLSKQKGKIVIINFWAQWCVDCRKELLILDEIYAKYQSRGLEIIGISIDEKKDLSKVLKIVEGKKYANAMLFDELKNSFGEPSVLPTSYIIDQTGKLITKIIPTNREIEKKDFEEIIENLLKS
jgi:thiol-disulfide isomerase/thioredoxin